MVSSDLCHCLSSILMSYIFCPNCADLPSAHSSPELRLTPHTGLASGNPINFDGINHYFSMVAIEPPVQLLCMSD